MSRLLTHRNCEGINLYGFKLLNFWKYGYAEIDNIQILVPESVMLLEQTELKTVGVVLEPDIEWRLEEFLRSLIEKT